MQVDRRPVGYLFPDWLPGALTVFGFWTVLFFLGNPLPYVDDLFFAGPALSLASGHGFVNPYCEGIRTIDPKDEFFVYMPLHSHVLAGFLALTGISRAALAGFQTIASALATLGLCRFIVAGPLQVLPALCISLCVIGYMSGVGLRPEGLGLALFSWGLMLLRARTRLVWFMSCSLLLATAITSPNFAPLIPLVFAYDFYRDSGTGFANRLLPKLGLALASLALVFAIFLIMIHGDLIRFLHVFNEARTTAGHAAGGFWDNVQQSAHSFRARLRLLFQILLPPLELLGVLAVAHFRRNKFFLPLRPAALLFVLIGGIAVYLPVLTSVAALRLPGFYSIVVVAAFTLILRVPYRLAGGLIWMVLFGLFLASVGHRCFQMATVPFEAEANNTSEIQQEILQLRPSRFYVDPVAAAYVFDYRLPPSAADYTFGVAGYFAAGQPSCLPPGSIVILSHDDAWAQNLVHSSPRPRALPIVGPLYPDLTANPLRCELVQLPGRSP